MRDQHGRVMGPEQMRRLTIENVDGVPLRLRASPAPGGAPEYVSNRFDPVTRDTVAARLVTRRNPLVFDTPCGRLGDVTLRYAGREMTLLFDVRKGTGYREVDSPPFQAGTFHLRRGAQELPCARGAAPPAIDDVIDRGAPWKCVPADNWQGMDEEWVRHLVPLMTVMGGIDPAAPQCRAGAVETMTTQAVWADAWRAHPSVARGNSPPDVDFRTQFVLAVHLPGQRPTYLTSSVRVDRRGDLTFAPAPRHPAYDLPGACGLVYLVLHRSGVRSVDGRPLPRPAAG